MSEDDIVVEVERVDKIELKAGIVCGKSREDGRLIFKGRINEEEIKNLHCDLIDEVIKELESVEMRVGSIIGDKIERLRKIKYNLTGVGEKEPKGEIVYDVEKEQSLEQEAKRPKSFLHY